MHYVQIYDLALMVRQSPLESAREKKITAWPQTQFCIAEASRA